jgi:tetratricopeptide (TPR) repeat protein
MIARALTQLAEVAMLEGKTAEARVLFEETLPIWREIGHKNGLADSLRGLGDVFRLAGDDRAAERVARESLALSHEIGARRRVAASLVSLARLKQSQNDEEEAERLFREALSLWSEMQRLGGIGDCIRGLATVDATQGRCGRAATLLGAAEAIRQTVGAVIPPSAQGAYERTVGQVKAELGDGCFDVVWQEGQAMPLEQAIACALKRPTLP